MKLAVALVLLLVSLFAGTALAQADHPLFGRTDIARPKRSDAGNWHGTWYYVTQGFRLGMWIDTSEGKPKIKLHYFRLGHGEQFETDWSGSAEYSHNQEPGSFQLEIHEADANTIKASWSWFLSKGEHSTREETARITMYRSGDGRAVVMLFDEHNRQMAVGKRVTPLPGQIVWTFRKASKRHARWDEIPF